jgi:hypothetical protein
MKYQDGANTVNGQYVGVSVGTRLADALSPSDDGYDYLRGVERIGTLLGDAIDENFPVPEEEGEE